MKPKLYRIAASVLALVTALSFTSAAAPALSGETSHTERTLNDGVVYSKINTASTSVLKKQNIGIVEVDLSQRNLYFDVEYGNNDNLTGLSTTTNTMKKFAQRNPDKTPIAGVNGDMWMVTYCQARVEGSTPQASWGGYNDYVVKKSLNTSCSFTIVDGEIFTSQYMLQETPTTGPRHAFGVTDDFVPIIGKPVVEMSLSKNGYETYADGINRLPSNDALVIYTDRLMGGRNGFALDDAYELLIDVGYDYKLCHGAKVTGTVTAKYAPTDSANPPLIKNTQMVLTARGNRIDDLKKFAVGDKISLDIELFDLMGDTERWRHVENSVGGNFALAINGESTHASPTELYPATIIASNKEGKLVLITMDGRNKGGGAQGLCSSKVVDELVSQLGLYNALLLDGGGSATMTLNENGTYTTVNTPTDGSERTVNNSVIISVGPQRGTQGELDLATGFDKDPTHITFDSKYDVSSLTYSSNNAAVEYEDKNLKLTCSGGDPFVHLDYTALKQKITAEDYKYATLVYRVPNSNARSNYSTEIFFNTNGQGARGGQSATGTVYRSDDYQYVTISAAALTEWKGTVSSLRLDFFADANVGDVMYIHDILFSSTTAQARTRAREIVAELNAPEYTTLTYDMRGHGTQLEPQQVPWGKSPVRPADPVEAGYVFAGWYTGTQYKTEFDFDSIPTKNTQIYAKWDIRYGDANGDGRINLRDVITVMRYMVLYDYDTNTPALSVYPGADANADGSINLKDILLIMRYVACYDYDTGKSSVVLGPQ